MGAQSYPQIAYLPSMPQIWRNDDQRHGVLGMPPGDTAPQKRADAKAQWRQRFRHSGFYG